MRVAISVLCLALFCSLAAQGTEESVPAPKKFSIESSGRDVRDVIHSLFTQARKSYILDPSVRHQLYMSIYDVDFDTAFGLLLEQANLHYEVREGIYYIGPQPVVVSPGGRPGSNFDWPAILAKKVSLKEQKVPIANAFNALGKSAGVLVKVDAGVPNYLVNVSFNNVTMRYALDTLTKAAQLSWEPMLDGAIRIFKAPWASTSSGEQVVMVEQGRGNVSPATSPGAIKCPNCSHDLRENWKYCPACGYWVRPITSRG